ncbi:sulfotransferase [Spongiibacter sp. KMU-166]|uniref:Sulfotransferase n=1 Tax=Spongiibacter thalassae TaxID=2721624 RepID=A0ABX1GA68_9GAMM|nr:sulfotransferase [Spongiibacter thalassae]NKI16048.1 sulfotransferase [Spongiibacter thalassae]
MDIKSVVPLDENSLLEAAKRNTGLSDFGDDEWYEPFKVLIKSLDEEADLHLMGRLVARSEILMLLEGRLKIEDTYKKHPEIEDEEIVRPVIIIGQGRSGTSFMQNLLSHNVDFGGLMHWEAMFPCPPPEQETYLSDPRIEVADKRICQWSRITPELDSMHEFSARLPHEDMAVMGFNFMSPSLFDCMGQVASYDAMVFNPEWDWEPAFRYHKKVLKLLQWKNPRKHWVLKDPLHFDRMKSILKVYPDACFVWPHRDPVRALASLVSIIGTIQWGRSEHPFKGGSLEYMTDSATSAARFNAVISQIENGEIPSSQIFNLTYKDFVASPITQVEKMLEHFGIGLSAEGKASMEKYLSDNPRDSRPPHRFNPGTPESIAKAERDFKKYIDYFDVPSEH